jgi:hypothetical protein
MQTAWPQWAEVAAAFFAVVAFAIAAVAFLAGKWRRENDPDEKERQRRLEVNRNGRIASGEVVDIVDQELAPNGARRRFLHYRYTVGAVEFAACQDVTLISERIGDDPRDVVGAVAVKYHNKNPYNSIIVCEQWSGFRRAATPTGGNSLAADPVRLTDA